MTLTKSDLSSIQQVVRDETKPQFEKLEKKIDKVNKKLDKHFKFIDKDVSYFRQKTADNLGIPVSNLIKTTD